MEKLQTKLSANIDGVEVEYGRLPFTLSEEWKGLSFYFSTSDCPEFEKHKEVIQKVIDMLVEQSFDHWSQWRLEKAVTTQCDEWVQETLVQFRVRDSY